MVMFWGESLLISRTRSMLTRLSWDPRLPLAIANINRRAWVAAHRWKVVMKSLRSSSDSQTKYLIRRVFWTSIEPMVPPTKASTKTLFTYRSLRCCSPYSQCLGIWVLMLFWLVESENWPPRSKSLLRWETHPFRTDPYKIQETIARLYNSQKSTWAPSMKVCQLLVLGKSLLSPTSNNNRQISKYLKA